MVDAAGHGQEPDPLEAVLFDARARQRQNRRAIRERKRLLVRPGSRPPIVTWVNRDGAPKRLVLPEWLFKTGKWMLWLGFAVLLILDSVREALGDHAVLSAVPALAWTLFGLAVAALALVIYDLATYSPKLVECSAFSCRTFFQQLGTISDVLVQFLSEIENVPPQRLEEAKDNEERLVVAARKVLFLNSWRAGVRLYVVQRVLAIVAGMAILGYALNYVTGPFTVTSVADAHFGDFVYIALTMFFTAGNDLIASGLAGYSYVALVLLGSALVVYFVVTDIVRADSEFNATLRMHSANFALVTSRLRCDPPTAQPA